MKGVFMTARCGDSSSTPGLGTSETVRRAVQVIDAGFAQGNVDLPSSCPGGSAWSAYGLIAPWLGEIPFYWEKPPGVLSAGGDVRIP